ncbi:hypothetical protein O181_101637 [Austropuccinia psidii MF-1]|uniref:Uncharacterized protein n=1 Tax=Austropuccinia psidii MF-1 TaxID=1389203 RepID=A0A9Q3PIQ8_9BASI|nr:hypothetical protein [Austropuccinia psidii MF-1]
MYPNGKPSKKREEKDSKGKGKAKVTEDEASSFGESEQSRSLASSQERITQKCYVPLCLSQRLYSQISRPSTCQPLSTQSRSSSGNPLSSHKEQGDSEGEERSRASFYISGSSEKHSYFNEDGFSILPKDLHLLRLFSTKILAPSSLTRLPKSLGRA